MPGSTNFLPFNPNANNQESDAAYTADSLRSNGAPSNGICPSPLFNKLEYQVSIFVAALAQMLVNKNYSPNDGSASPGSAMANLVGVLANIMTAADMAPFALLNSPTFTGVPRAPTPAPGDNSTTIPTTAFIQALMSVILPVGALTAGKFIQAGVASGTSVVFAVAFSSAPIVIPVGIGGSVNIAAVSNTGFTINTSTGSFHWIAFGSR